MTRDELKQILEYVPETGIFFWLVSRGKAKAGEIAGSIYPNGYVYIEHEDIAYRASRLAWLYVYGWLPADFVDHRNKRKDDNRIENLRVATNSQNQANRGKPSNNTSGLKGIRFEADRQKWVAKIMIEGKAKNLGRYITKRRAAIAYAKAAIAAWGDFADIEEHLAFVGLSREECKAWVEDELTMDDL